MAPPLNRLHVGPPTGCPPFPWRMNLCPRFFGGDILRGASVPTGSDNTGINADTTLAFADEAAHTPDTPKQGENP